jgi:hypothetical protein
VNDSRHNGLAPAARRVRLMAGQALGEALRMRLVSLLAVVAALMLAGARWLRDFNFGAAEIAFIGDFGLGVTGLLGTVLAALATAQLFFADLDAGAAACVLTRPVRRWEYLAGKFAGVAGLLALFTASLGGLLGGLIWWRASQLGAPGAALSIFLGACALQWMKFTLVAGMTLGVCAYAGSALFASCAGLLLTAIGHLRPWATDGLEWLRIWPNLALFDAGGLLAAGRLPGGAALITLAGYWAGCLLVCGFIASYAFRRREF